MRKIKTDIDEKIQEDKEKSSLRPADFSSYIGQKKICESLHIAIQSAKTEKNRFRIFFYMVRRDWARQHWQILWQMKCVPR